MTDVRRPWSLDPGRTPVERILGHEFSSGGPLGLLGLAPDACTPGAVADALARQLERVNDHPHATSHEADEVRLALHAAAAQLMDPQTREALIGAALAGQAWLRPRRPLSPLAVVKARAEIRRTLGRFGGLNERSIRFLSLVADRHGIMRDQLGEAVRAAMREPARPPRRPASRPAPGTAPAGPRPPGSAPFSPGASASRPAPEEIDPAVRTLRLVLIIGGVGLGAVLLALAGVGMIVRGLASPPPAVPKPPPGIVSQAPPSPGAEPQRTPQAEAPKAVAPQTAAPTPAAPIDAVSEHRRLAHAVDKLANDPEGAIADFARAFEALGAAWTDLAPDQIASTQDSVVEFLYRAGDRPEIATRAGQAVIAGSEQLRRSPAPAAPDRILPAVWSVGTLARLARERELPAQVRGAIDTELAVALSGAVAGGGGSFAYGASAAVLAIPHALVRKDAPSSAGPALPDAFDRWLRAARAVAAGDERTLDRFILAGLETLLTDGPEPDSGTPAALVVQRLVTAATWRADSESRTRLIRWFDAKAISSVDLNAVTGALAGASGAEGVDLSMVLANHADLPQRQELRDRYLAAWSLKDKGAADALVAEWAKTAREQLAPPDHTLAPAEQLARAAILARVNLAATLLHAGLSAEPGDILRALDAPVTGVIGAVGGSAPIESLDQGASDGSWAVRYLMAEKNIPQRAALLSELGHGPGTLGRADADVLATEAFRGSPAQVRRAAADLMVKFSASPAVINAALEQAPYMPRTQDASDLVRKLSLGRIPGLRDPQWRLSARRALVERLLQMVAQRGDDRVVDGLSEVLGDAYAGRASVAAVDRDESAASEKLAPDAAARAVRMAWQRWASGLTPSGHEPFPLDQIERRHAGRAGLAEGLVQTFAGEQVTVAELMAYVVAGERPDSAPQVRAITDRLAKARREADHVFAQILACERAMAELWIIRLEGGTS